MVDLSDWVWLVVVAFWVVLRVLPRLFKSKSKTPTAPKQRKTGAKPVQIPSNSSFGHDHMPEPSPTPIEPK